MDLSKKIEPQTWAFLEKLTAAGGPPLYTLSPQEARGVLLGAQDIDVPKKAVSIEEHTLPVGPSDSVSITIYRPKDAPQPLPAVMYFHGGGWVMGDKNTHDRLVREIAVGTPAAVVFVNYTPSPEAKYPVPIEEAYAATKFIAENSKTFNLDPSKLAVMGDSVGGNMAIAVCLLAKERKAPAIQYQVLFYPVTDAGMNTESYNLFADGPWLTKPAMKWFWDQYLPDVNERKKITASPLQASIDQLKGLPPALVITDEFDVLRDEGEAFAKKLNEAGVPVTPVRFESIIHDFVMLNALTNTPQCRGAIALAIATLQKVFAEK